jgi:hypothetical protein
MNLNPRFALRPVGSRLQIHRSIFVAVVALPCAAASLFAVVISNFSAQAVTANDNEADGTSLTVCLAHPSPAWTFTRHAVQPATSSSMSAGQQRGAGRKAKSAERQTDSYYLTFWR